jgi:TM2 domain-containing membrane protein YozV
VSFCFSSAKAAVCDSEKPDTTITGDTINVPDSITYIYSADIQDMSNPINQDSVKASNYKSKKLVAAILAFPIPFGLLGLHRLFLGTKPYIPFVYIGTLGGCFLIVPIIDFITILAADEEDFKRFENNPKVFMWSH